MNVNVIKKRRKLKRDTLPAIIFILPGFLGFAVFYFFPVLSSLFMSVMKWNFSGSLSDMTFNGLKNYAAIFEDKAFIASISNSLIFTLVTVMAGVALSLVLAVLIKNLVFQKTAMRTMFFIPYISSAIAVAAVWRVLFNPSKGPINQFLMSLGVENTPGWLADFNWALPAVILIYVWQNLGYNIAVYMAGLAAVPNDLYEAASIDGAGGIRKFFSVTVPMTSPISFFLIIMGIINSFKVFDQVYVLTGGGPGNATSMLSVYIYNEAFKYYRAGTASAAAWIMFVIIFAVTIFQWYGQRKWVVE